MPFLPPDAALHPAIAVAAFVGVVRWSAHGSRPSRSGLRRRDSLDAVETDCEDGACLHCVEHDRATIHPRDFTSNS